MTCAISRPSLEDMPTPRGCKALASEPSLAGRWASHCPMEARRPLPHEAASVGCLSPVRCLKTQDHRRPCPLPYAGRAQPRWLL